jgi:hypothetical protein
MTDLLDDAIAAQLGRPLYDAINQHLADGQHAEAALERVRDLADQWVKAGPPPLGTSMARWWDRRLVELNAALAEPKDQT